MTLVFLEYAAAFFLLGGSLKDAVNVCLKQLADFQLAVALARVVEGDDGVVLRSILQDHVIPRAFREGNRWLGSWAFWMLKRRDFAVRILLVRLTCGSSPFLNLTSLFRRHYESWLPSSFPNRRTLETLTSMTPASRSYSRS